MAIFQVGQYLGPRRLGRPASVCLYINSICKYNAIQCLSTPLWPGAHAGESRLQFRSMPRESKSEAEWNLRQAIFRIALVTWKARARNEVRRVSAPEKPPFLSFRRIQDLNFFSFCSEFSSFSGHTAPTILIFSFWVESTKMSTN